MARRRTAVAAQVAELLRTAKESLGLSVAFLSRLDETTQHLEVVESSIPLLFSEGVTRPRESSFCQAILDGRLPPVIPDVAANPVAMSLPAAAMPRIRSFVSAPVVLSDGTVYGTFCAAGLRADKALTMRDKALMDVLAHAAAVIVEPAVLAQQRSAEIEGRLQPLIEAGGPTIALQPIVELATGHRVGAEALSRFPAGWDRPPDVCFDEAHSIGYGEELELIALRRAAEHLDHIDGYLALNISPTTLLTPAFTDLMLSLPLDRILLELSEHDPVQDYPALTAVLAPLRAAGMRLAIDDVGAGFASMRHIVLTAPDVIKLDRSIITGVSKDVVLHKLATSLVSFGHSCGALVVAEGIEEAADVAALLDAGVDLGQGWHFGRPGPPDALVPVGVATVAAGAR